MGPGHGKRTDDKQQHTQGNCLSGFFGFENAAKHHADSSDKTDLPDCEGFEHIGLKHHYEGRAEEDRDAGNLREGGQRRFF